MNKFNTTIMKMDDDSKIMYITEKVLGATSKNTACTLEQIIEKGIEMGVTETYPRGKMDGHPWSPRTSLMMGVGNEQAVYAHEEVYLHRKKMKRNGRKSCFFYWVDRSKKHEFVPNNIKANDRKANEKQGKSYLSSRVLPETLEEKIAKTNANPEKYLMVGDKLISREWAVNNPEKFKTLYGNMS